VTYSIAAFDAEASQWGVAVQSKFLAVGSVVPWAEPEVGAIATQAYANPRYGPEGLALLRQGLAADEVVGRLTSADEGRAERQLGVVDAIGRGASYTGEGCQDWAGGRTGPGYAAQGNILVSAETVDGLADTFEQTAGTGASLAERLLDCLDAAQAAGGDSRGQQSSAIVVERVGAASESREGLDRVCELRVEDHAEPIAELRRLLGIHLVWDALRRATAFHEPGRYAEGAAVLSEALALRGEDAVLLYDLACFESLAGEIAPALQHARRSLELDPGLRAGMAADPDFVALAGDPQFQALVR
jgi:uncharacterized Ntn-hydrolase superfamily protein